MWSVVLLFVKQIQIICSGNSQDIVRRVPHCMQNFAGVVQVVDADLITSSPVGLGGHDLVVEDLAELGHVPRCLVAVLVFVDAIKYSEKVVVRTCDDVPVTKKLLKKNKFVRTNCQIIRFVLTKMSDHKLKLDSSMYCSTILT